MKLSWKLTLALVAGMVAVLVVHAVLGARREASFLEASARRQTAMLGRALAAVVNEVWRSRGEARARSLVAEANQRDRSVELRWVWLQGREVGDDAPAAPQSELLGLASGSEEVWSRVSDRGDRLLTYVRLRQDGGRAAALELSASLDGERSHIRLSLQATALTTVVMGLVAAGLSMVLGAWFVGHPMGKLIAKARRVGAGDLSEPLVMRQRDELGELAREMNMMCEHLAEARDRLASETTRRISALEQLRHADRLTVVGKVSSGLAHELGTPLHVIGGWAKMIAAREIDGDDVVVAAGHICAQADRVARLIRQLLDFARRRQPRKQPTDLCQLVRQTATLLAPLAEKRHVALVVNAEVVDGLVLVDAGHLQQALANLVVNGLDAMPTGGTLTVDVVEDPHPDGDEPFLAIAVRDTGSGIPAEQLDQVFEPFFTTKPVGEGTGLGLSVARGIVEEHGGRLQVESAPGVGSCFVIHLPKGVRACPEKS